MEKRRYAVLGVGRRGQGKAAAYDLGMFGNASTIIVADREASAAVEAADELNRLIGKPIVQPITLDATNPMAVLNVLRRVDGFVSAIHYNLNPALTKIAIAAKCHMVDLGGNTGIVWKQHRLDGDAKSARIRIIPDCGMAPGFNINLACAALQKIAHPKSAMIYCGGIPERPEPPLCYHFPFSVEGLINECSGQADVILGGEVTQRSCLFSIESVNIPEVGELEATHTSGGLSTSPWTLAEQYRSLEIFEYMTLRDRGHWKTLQDWSRKGELASKLRAHAEKSSHDPMDIGIIQARANGLNERGREKTVILEVIDRYDSKTGFTAMQRLTGFHASIMLIAATETLKETGVLKVESVDPQMVINEFARRGIVVQATHAVLG